MTQIPAHKIEEIRNRFDIVEVVSSYIDLKKAGRNYVGLCPFHPEKSPSFTVSPEKQLYHCFGCQNGGNLFNFIMQLEGLSFPEAARFLAKRAGIEIENEPMSPAEQRKARLRALLLQTNTAARDYYQYQLWQTTAGREALLYLLQRGLDEQTVKAFKLGYAPAGWHGLTAELTRRGFDGELGVKAGLLAGKTPQQYYDIFRERIIFPIENGQGETLGFGGRLLKEGEPRYLNTPETFLYSKGSLLYGLPQALPAIRRGKEVLLVEGYLDVILLHQHGLTHAVAPLGTALTAKQVSLLRARMEKITLAFDGDAGGEKATLRSLEILEREGCRVAVAMLPVGKDPADVLTGHGKAFLEQEILVKSVTILEYRLHALKKNYNLQKEEERLAYWQKARVLLAGSSEAVEREAQLKKIAAEIGSSLEVLRGDLEKIILGHPAQSDGGVAKEREKGKLSPRALLEKEILSSLLQYPRFAAAVWQEILPDDFSHAPFREIAGRMHELFRQGAPLETATLLSYFSEGEMHKILMNLSFDSRPTHDEAMALKTIKSCLRRNKILRWTEEREYLIKSLGDSNKREDISSRLRRVQELKKWEEELYRSGEGENSDG
ncbi:MAG: DNA primase [Bacillota bacterium]